jgi:outer membrane protein assembly factor BamB
VIWRAAEQGRQQDLFLAPTGASGSVDGDGTPDLIGHVRDWEKVGPHSMSTVSRLAAFSGRDGRRIWTAKDLKWGDSMGSTSGPGWSYEHPLLDAADLDGDGITEVLCVQSRSNEPLLLSAGAGKDGHLLWEIPIATGGWAPRPSAGRRPLADLNGDGTLDVVVWRPTGNSVNRDGPCQLVASDGRDGTTLWRALPPEVPDGSRPLWPEPTVGDLDGDGVAEVIVAVHQGFDADGGYACDLMAVDGRTGAVRWKWHWRAGFPQMWPPLLIADRDGRQLVCAGLKDLNGRNRIVVMDDRGRLTHEFELDGGATRDALTQGSLGWRAVDLEGDGGAELLFINQGRLVASRGARLETMWTWELPDEATLVSESRPASAGRSAEILVWSGKSAYGLSGGTGRPLWRCDAPSGPRWGMSDPPELLVVNATGATGLPNVQLWWPDHSDHGWATVCRQAWPVTESGTYRAPTPERVDFTALPPVTVPGRPLPWVANRDTLVWFYSGLASLLVLGVPGVLICLAVKRRSSLPALLLAGYAAVSVWVEAQALLPLLAAGLACWMLWRAARTRSLSGSLTAVLALGLALLPLLWQAGVNSMDRPAGWGAGWWLNEFLIEPLVVALVALPGAAFWIHLGLATRLRQWSQVRWLLLLSTILAAALALLFVWADRADEAVQEPYSLRGWYWIWMLGAFAAGLASLLVLGRLVRNLWRERRQATAAVCLTTA